MWSARGSGDRRLAAESGRFWNRVNAISPDTRIVCPGFSIQDQNEVCFSVWLLASITVMPVKATGARLRIMVPAPTMVNVDTPSPRRRLARTGR